MRCDSRASLLAHTFVSLYLGCEPKARVVTREVLVKRRKWAFLLWLRVKHNGASFHIDFGLKTQ
jgi:hypothetical protein